MNEERITELKSIAVAAIDKYADELNKLSLEIWNNPELHYQEHKAHGLLVGYLQSKDFKVDEKFVVDTGFRATHGKTDKPNIAVLCEYDALPEIGHACGHNLIAELGIGAAMGIKAALGSTGDELGKLTVLGTPAEEAGGGKVDFINGGVFDDIDCALMGHPSNATVANPVVLAMTEVYVTYKGRASHAAGSPWEGLNALDAAVLAYNNISCLRQQCKPGWRIHGIITKGGVAANIIPDESKLLYYMRAQTEGELTVLKQKITDCLNAAALSTGCHVDLKWDPKPYSNLIGNSTLLDLYKKNSKTVGVEFTPGQENRIGGSTDMGNVSHVVPGIHPNYYIVDKVPAHTPLFRDAAGTSEAHRHTLDQAKILAMTAVDIYCKPELLLQIKQDFKNDIAKDASGE